MEKKNTLLLTVIAVATLLVAVVGATFAYFGSFQATVNDKAAVNVHTGTVEASTFITTGGTLSLNVPGNVMIKGENPAAVPVGTKTDSANLVVKLNYPDKATQMTCTYDVYFAYDESSPVYGIAPTPVTNGTESKEFTYTLTPSEGITVESTYATTSGAKSFSLFAPVPTEQEPTPAAVPVKVAHGSITATGTTTSPDTAATQNLLADVNFYNFPTIDQSALASKDFKGSFYVKEDSVKCSTAAVSGS